MIERFYGRSEELEKKFDAAEKAGDAQTMQACRDAYQELVKEVQAEGEDFGNMMRLYSDMKKARQQPPGPFRSLSGTEKDPSGVPGIRGERIHLFLHLVQRHPGCLGIHPAGLRPERDDRNLRIRPEIHEQRIRKNSRLPLQPLRSRENQEKEPRGLLLFCLIYEKDGERQ